MKKAIDAIYKNRKEFIIIGLTGRTGSGCTTAAQIISSEKKDIFPKQLRDDDKPNSETLKQNIIYKYFNKNWVPFSYIKISDIITSFVLQHSKDELSKYLNAQRIDGVKHINLDAINYNYNYKRTTSIIKYLENRKKSDKVIEYVEKSLAPFSSDLKNHLTNIDKKLYTKLYQLFGDNIRRYGTAIPAKNSTASNIYSIAERTNHILKAYRGVSINRFVLDAIRNPFEALFFKERYSAFYLISINCKEVDRRDRLYYNLNLSPSDLEELDKKESGENNIYTDITGFVGQNIPECIQKSDIHIQNNGAHSNSDKTWLTAQIIKYIVLIEKPGIITPSVDEKIMQIAYTAKANSGCISRQVGAVVINGQNQIAGIGWNDTPEGQTSCLFRNVNDILHGTCSKSYSEYEKNDQQFHKELKNRYSHNEEKLEGRNLSFCFRKVYNRIKNDKNQVHTRALHAEENAFLQIAKHGGVGAKAGSLYSTASPCELCAKKAYQLGVKRIVFIDPYPGISTDHILNSGKRRPTVSCFVGAVGQAYHKLYDPIIAYKDELEALE